MAVSIPRSPANTTKAPIQQSLDPGAELHGELGRFAHSTAAHAALKEPSSGTLNPGASRVVRYAFEAAPGRYKLRIVTPDRYRGGEVKGEVFFFDLGEVGAEPRDS